MPIAYKIVLVSTGFLSALITGLLYAYSCSVNAGLGRLSDAGYLRAMQSINRAILNPWFFASFMGTLVLLPVCAWLCYRNEAASASFYLLSIAALVYLVGVFGVTMFGNVPLNDMLDKINIGIGDNMELNAQRLGFEKPWNRFHLVRTIASQISLLLTLAAMVVRL